MAQGRLTTHVLDTARGVPAKGVAFSLYRCSEDFRTERAKLCEGWTNADGRADAPILQGEDFLAGSYCLDFAIGDYFAATDIDPRDQVFLDIVSLNFRIVDSEAHYHVPLLASPFGYTTYRGS